MIRNIWGDFAANGNLGTMLVGSYASGAFGPGRQVPYHYTNAESAGYAIVINANRVVPTGAANKPRAWGALACAYLGTPAS